MIEIEVKFLVDGREVSARSFEDVVMRQLLESIKSDVEEKLSQVRCPEHHQRPRVIASGPSLKRLEFHVEGCCEKLVDIANKALKG